MPRPKLTPEEREARRKERNRKTFSDANYIHYEWTDGFGSADEWRQTIGERLGMSDEDIRDFSERLRKAIHEDVGYDDMVGATTTKKRTTDLNLLVLGLDEPPVTYDTLYAAYRRAAKHAHPDMATGSHEAFLAVQKAFETLKRRFGK